VSCHIPHENARARAPLAGEHFAATAGTDNQTPHELTIQWLGDDGEWRVPITSVAPNRQESISVQSWYGTNSLVGRNGCTFVPLRAVRRSGEVVGRQEPPLCEDELWVVAPSPQSSERAGMRSA